MGVYIESQKAHSAIHIAIQHCSIFFGVEVLKTHLKLNNGGIDMSTHVCHAAKK